MICAGNFVLQFAAPHLQHLRGAIQNLSAQIGALLRPIRESCAGRDDRVTKIFFRGPAEIRQDIALCSVSGKNAAVLAPDEFSADIELVGLLDLEAFAVVWHELTIA